MESLKVIFNESRYDSSKRLRKDRWTTIQVEAELIPVKIKFHGEEVVLYYRYDERYNGDNRNNKMLTLYTEKGDYAKGIWQHGHYGTERHIEGVSIWASDMSLVTCQNYQNGRVKDSKKYLLSIKVN